MANALKNLFGKKEETKGGIDWAMYPARLAPGLFFLSSATDKAGADEDTAKGLQGFAGAIPGTDKFDPNTFAKLLSAAEYSIGGALVLPFIPNRLAGAALTAFSAGLLTMYLKTPGMVRDGSKVRPSSAGTALAKDFWLFGTGVSLMMRGNK
nr:hypothetical protein [Corynebacterium lactis]